MSKQKWIEKGLELGFNEIEIYETTSNKLSMSLFESKVDAYTISNDHDYLLKGIVNEKMARCHLATLVDSEMEEVLLKLKENALSIESDDISSLYEGESEYPTLEVRKNTFRNKSYDEKVSTLKNIESLCLQADTRIEQVMSVDYEEVHTQVSIVNSKGMDISKENDYALVAVSLLASENGENQSGYHVDFIVDDDFDEKEFTSYVLDKTLSKLNAKQVKSGQYKVLFKNNAMRSLLGSLVGLFVGENVYKGISILKDKMNEKIFDEKITLIDDSLLANSFNSSPFDDEGVSGKTTVLVDHGVLKSYLHNLKSAKMMNCEPTGNGYTSSTSPTNLSIMKGESSFEDMVSEMKDGIIIDEISGLHAGLNTLTTQFSLLASGYEVKEGKIVGPVHLITVAGVFVDMMKEVLMVGDDLESGISGIGSPSILFESLSISGE